MSYGELLSKAREMAASGTASETGDQRLAGKGASSRKPARYRDDGDDSGLMYRAPAASESPIDSDFMSMMFNKVYANNKKIALAMDKTGFKPISIEDEVSVSKDEVSASKDEVSTSEGDFLDKLYQSESSNDSKSDRTNKDGKRFVGLGNFGQDRIDDAQKPVAQGGMGISFTLDEFKNNIKLQKKVATWHIKDIDKAIDRLGNLSKGYNRNGLRAVAHLGGITGMKNFVKNQDNPKDELGTSLLDYYTKFS